jgi:hypothetical protein
MLFGIRNISIKVLPPAGEFLFETQGKGLNKNHESKYPPRCILGVDWENLSKNSTNISQKFTYFALTV